MVPATISRIHQWLGLAQFMGQKFTTHFFELPGHGGSSAFNGPYNSDLVAESVGHLADALGYETFSLMGFSFGGLLTLKTLAHLEHRIERVIMIAPCVSHRALTFSKIRKGLLKQVAKIFRLPGIQRTIISSVHHPRYVRWTAGFIRMIGRVEDTIPLKDRLHTLPASTLDVLTYQVEEVMHLDLPARREPYSMPLFFGMSVNDPLLDFTRTYNFIDSYFSDISTACFTFPYHQPPGTPTFEDLQRDFSNFLEKMEPI